jgi:hypothetical protein
MEPEFLELKGTGLSILSASYIRDGMTSLARPYTRRRSLRLQLLLPVAPSQCSIKRFSERS